MTAYKLPFTARNNNVVAIIKALFVEHGLDYLKLIRERRINTGIDDHSIKFYGIRGNLDFHLMAQINGRLKSLDVRVETYKAHLRERILYVVESYPQPKQVRAKPMRTLIGVLPTARLSVGVPKRFGTWVLIATLASGVTKTRITGADAKRLITAGIPREF